ncbi:hypothetical protein KAI30_03390 [Candidatus Bathyarchaeota archaeon]|nr:hypothetical protein [Candidatus Bathyarchaeota archaeon]
MDVELTVDGKKIGLSKFVVKILAGTITGATSSLRGIDEDWKELKIKVTR